MYIRKFLLVICIVSFVFCFLFICENRKFTFFDYDFGLDWISFDYLLYGKKASIVYEDKVEDILFEIYIPRINLNENVYTMDSIFNDVDYHVEILRYSSIIENLYFLAAHSGGGRASYFDNLVDLEIGDIILIRSGNGELVFVVKDMFYIQKDGYFEVRYSSNGDTLFLITCSLMYVDKQLVIRADLI